MNVSKVFHYFPNAMYARALHSEYNLDLDATANRILYDLIIQSI